MSNLTKSLQFRELTALLIRAAGVEGVEMRPRRAFGAVLADEASEDEGDLRGLPGGWYLKTRNETQRELTAGLREAEEGARLAGRDRPAVVWARPGENAERSFVVMTLDTFTRVLLDAQERVS